MINKILITILLVLISPNIFAIYDPDPKTVPATATADFRMPRIRIAAQAMPVNGFSSMGVRCKYVKGGKFDPIIFPGQNNVGHHHTFFGNTGIAPNSTGQSLLLSGGTNCIGGSLAKSSFWAPSTIDIRNNQFVAPTDVIVYYTAFGKTANNQFRRYIKPIPHGLKMLPKNIFTYHCINNKGVAGARSNTQIPVCNEPGGFLLYQLHSWPHCWDGKNLDSPDHKSHVVFTSGDWRNNPNECPSTHPVRIPQLNVFLSYPFKQAGETRYWRLASDTSTALPGSSLHGDYMGGINESVQQIFIQNCLIANKHCSIGKLGPYYNAGPFELF